MDPAEDSEHGESKNEMNTALSGFEETMFYPQDWNRSEKPAILEFPLYLKYLLKTFMEYETLRRW